MISLLSLTYVGLLAWPLAAASAEFAVADISARPPPSAAAKSRPDSPPSAGSTGAPSEPSTSDPAKLATTLADKRLLPLTPENVKEKLAPIAALTSRGPEHETQWKFHSDRKDKEVPRVEVAFFKDGNGKWTFGQLEVRLIPQAGDLAALYDATASQFKKKLGKSGRQEKAPPGERAAYWDLKKQGLQLGVQERIDPDNGPKVEVTLFVPQGEAE